MNNLPGYILITQNLTDNTTPGLWNHCAIYTDQGVVEAQENLGVIVSDLTEFMNRYPKILIIEMTSDTVILKKMSDEALNLVGTKYRKSASVFNWLRNKGENCVSLVRKCYIAGFNKDPKWILPDDVAKYGKIVYEKV